MKLERTVVASFAILFIGEILASNRMLASDNVDRSVSPRPASHPPEWHTVGHPTFASPHASPIALNGKFALAVNTADDTLDVIDRESKSVVRRIAVGIDPVSVVVRPDGKEIWVANHISDSISIIDNVESSWTYLQVVATIQSFDERGATEFDEPVGIAFANNGKAYVALSSENQIAVIDVANRSVSNRIRIPAQDPRAIRVRNNRLYVLPFESNNKTQLSGGSGDEIDGDLVTFDAWQHSVIHNNVLSLGHTVDIIKHPEVPDRDLFIYDTANDELLEVVDSLGTLLYGMTVDSQGRVLVAQTDARNDVNGRAGTQQHSLKELGNRAFLNRITSVKTGVGPKSQVSFIDLEPLPPTHPTRELALATPYAIEVSNDDRLVFVTAAGSDKLCALDPDSGELLGQVSVGAVPRGVALECDASGKAITAWIFNAVDNSVSVVDVSKPQEMQVTGLVTLNDPTAPEVKLGRTWFNDADASTSGTFSCASCHPDGHTDQLLWVLKTPIVSGGDQIMPRSTMPIRGLQDTAPFHWDGIPGDPYGGNNSANVHGSDSPNCDINAPESAPRHLIDGGLASTMLQEGDSQINDEGKPGYLTAAQRNEMANFLLSLPYPPAQRRAFNNIVSERAADGFELFHIKGHLDEKPRPNVCGDCHRMPFLVSTNTPGTGMDAPTWRGAYDRFLILPQGRLNILEFDFYRRIAEQGTPERKMWQFSWQGQSRFDPVWDMVLEGSTGFSGAYARQTTLARDTVDQQITLKLLDALEKSTLEGAVILEIAGTLKTEASRMDVNFQYHRGSYLEKDGKVAPLSRNELIGLAEQSRFVGTATGHHAADADVFHPQPAIWTLGPIEKQRGHQEFPILHPDNRRMTISGRHLDANSRVFVDGRRTKGSIELRPKEEIVVSVDTLPASGMHLLQLQNSNGMFSNDFIFYVTTSESAAKEHMANRQREDRDIRDVLAEAVARGDLPTLRRQLDRQRARVNQRQPSGGSTPLSTAALFGRREVAAELLQRGADVQGTNQDGNTALHVAAFLCNKEIVDLLLDNGADVERENRRGESPVDVVSGEWSVELARFYQSIANSSGIVIDLARIEAERPQMAAYLRTKVADE